MTQYSARKALKKKNKKKFQALNGAELDNEAEIKQLEVSFLFLTCNELAIFSLRI